ncbi:MAG TPA: HAD-IA family hydrolase [Pirellulales bacterium]|jgi:FMN phosphatase YigB (HAD superfamily)|nr:HAD-IA family hydrolase [Pirellulales bacterium]
MKKIVLVLDAMGVIYQSADDVVELLAPFIKNRGGIADLATVEKLYVRASLGELTATQFWDAVGIPSHLEREYLSQHRLTEGLQAFLANVPSSVGSIWCLSNDVSEWSHALREKHGLARYFAGFIISGDVRSRKPIAAIYEALLSELGLPATDCVFVDDRIKNLNAAKELGFRTVLFAPGTSQDLEQSHPVVKSFDDLGHYLTV